MSNRPHTALRTSLSRLAVAGAATVAAVFTIAPMAVADDEPTANQPTDQPAPPTDDPAAQTDPAPVPAADDPADPPPASDPVPDSPQAPDPAPSDPAPRHTTAKAQLVTNGADIVADPTYGPQTFRVGAKIAASAWVPDGTTTAGSTFNITYTDGGGGTTSESCTSSGPPDVDGITYCPTTFTAPAGVTVSVAQSSSVDGTLVNTTAQTLSPCDLSDPDPCPSTDLVFTDGGAPPVAHKDKATTDANTPVLVDVLANDVSGDPATTISLSSGTTAHGSATIVTDGGRQKIKYTPTTGFTDAKDVFSYTLTNTNGSTSANVTVAVGDVAPAYGSQKYRVGVQIASGAYVPAGTTTDGSEFAITTTLLNGTSSTVTCTTSFGYCPGDFPFGTTTAPAGSTVTVVQTKAVEGLTLSTETKTLPPCDSDANDCMYAPDFLFTDNGIGPVAGDDNATTQEGEPVTIDVLGNDDSADPSTTLAVNSQPSHGKAKVVGSGDPGMSGAARVSPSVVADAGTLAITYTPKAGFSGTDTFTYSVTNSNGTTTGTVTIKVIADGPDTDDSDGTTGDQNGTLPDTGGPDVRLFGLAGILIAAGSALTAAGRRRRPGAHSA